MRNIGLATRAAQLGIISTGSARRILNKYTGHLTQESNFRNKRSSLKTMNLHFLKGRRSSSGIAI